MDTEGRASGKLIYTFVYGHKFSMNVLRKTDVRVKQHLVPPITKRLFYETLKKVQRA